MSEFQLTESIFWRIGAWACSLDKFRSRDLLFAFIQSFRSKALNPLSELLFTFTRQLVIMHRLLFKEA